MFADVGQDLARELERDFDRELDVMADELLLLPAAGHANSIMTHRHQEGDDPRFPPLPREQQIKTLLEALDDDPNAAGSTPATPAPAGKLVVEPVKVVPLLGATNNRRSGSNPRNNRRGSGGQKRRRGRSSRRTSSRRRKTRGKRSKRPLLGGKTSHHRRIDGDQIEGFSDRGMAAKTGSCLDEANAAINPSNRLSDSLDIRPTAPRTAAVAATPIKDSEQNTHRYRAGARPSSLQSAAQNNKQRPPPGGSENYVGGHSRSVRRVAGKAASAPRGNILRTSPFLLSAVIGTAMVIGLPAQRPRVLIAVLLLHATAALARAFARLTEVRISNRYVNILRVYLYILVYDSTIVVHTFTPMRTRGGADPT